MAELDWKEVRRYLGLGPEAADAALEARLRDSGAALTAAARPRSVWRRFPLELGEGRVFCAGMDIASAHLRRHLEGCTGAVLLAATLGAETDRLLRRAAVTDMSRAVLLQACAAALLEGYCDQCCQEMGAQAAGEGLYLRPRFSPGYGDFSISFQRPLLEALEAPKRIGLAATGAMMLTPTKSVTAVVGLSPDRRYVRPGGCGNCGSCPRTGCPYRLV